MEEVGSCGIPMQLSHRIVSRIQIPNIEGWVAKFVEETIRLLCEWKSVDILELNVRENHIRAVVSFPPKLSISELMGLLRGKTAIKLFKSYTVLKKKPYRGNHFLSCCYCVSTIGLDENKIRRYVKYKEEKERLEESGRKEFGLF